jgi:hypothetical protein
MCVVDKLGHMCATMSESSNNYCINNMVELSKQHNYIHLNDIHEKQRNTTVRTVPKSNRKTTQYHTVRPVPIEKQQNTTLSGHFQHL